MSIGNIITVIIAGLLYLIATKQCNIDMLGKLLII